ncbi:hypothetical protein BDY21DRAFT_367420 [Lineolata rhizophorae]|uniref:Uncharacterized protein n=1 Tax=Lineolata rhizophorae TaxID=578093 RepID=A0A6A6NM97_9PEZI|nr:hypothetical protein BDY21DRAFT_367420 [Lineolata rhizophorae]
MAGGDKEHIPQEGKKEDQDQGTGGFLSPLGDPLGNALGAGLRPIGATVETITKPVRDGVGNITKPALGPATGAKEDKMEVLGGDNKDSYAHGKDSVAGRLQTAENPLGLESQERWGFREEK